jgi:hypothetical protein
MRIGKLLLTAVAAVGVTCGYYAAYCGLLLWSGNFSSIVGRALIASVLSPHSTATPLKDRVRKLQRANYRYATGIFRI